MSAIKRLVKALFYRTRTVFIYDRLHFLFSRMRHAAQNKKFRKENPHFALPPDYFLHETYKLDYRQYKEDGAVTASEFLEWTAPFLPQPKNILEWGCGVGRIIRHLPGLSKNAKVVGADINEAMIAWDAAHIPDVQFVKTDYQPPLPFTGQAFDLVFAFSVFTHIEYRLQQSWLQEIHRILMPDGIFLFTTHGKKYRTALSVQEQKQLDSEGGVTKSYQQKGHRMMGTYNTHEAFLHMAAPWFELLAYYDGAKYPEKVGGQDLWIMRRK